MRGPRSGRIGIVWAAALVIAASAVAPAALARTPVDPTTLTPPLKAFRVCYQLGPYVQCDTSGDTTYGPEENGELSCGTLYEFGEDVSHSTRWYQDGLIVRRQIQEHSRGFWSLSPDGTGPTVEWQRDFSWNEEFSTPGDIDSAVRVYKGTTLRVPALGSDLMEAGWALPDSDILHGRFVDDQAAAELLCPLLTAA